MDQSFLIMLSNLLHLQNQLDPTTSILSDSSTSATPSSLLTSTSAALLLFFTIASVLSYISTTRKPRSSPSPPPSWEAESPSFILFISCLRNGLILCNAINKIQPGSVPKVVEITRFHSQSQSHTWDSQPLPAYQFFENVRNFLKAVEGLNLPVFEASVFERDNMEAGSSTKIVDCVLGLKDYAERKNGSIKRNMRSPLLHSNSRIPRSGMNLDTNRQLDLSVNREKQSPSQNDAYKLEDSIVKSLADCMSDAKENLDGNLLSSLRNGNMDSIKSFTRILSSTLEEQSQFKLNPNMKDLMKEISGSFMSLETSSLEMAKGIAITWRCFEHKKMSY